MPVRTEYSVVKIVSLVVSANWPMKAKFTAPSGTPSGRSPTWQGVKNDVTYGLITGTVRAPSAASRGTPGPGAPTSYHHSCAISSPVDSWIVLPVWTRPARGQRWTHLVRARARYLRRSGSAVAAHS